MDGFQPTEKAPLIEEHESEMTNEHPMRLAGMGFVEGEDVSLLKTRVFDLAKTLEGLRSDVVFKAEKIKEGDKALQVLTTKIYEKQAVDLVNEIAKAKSVAAVKSHEMDRLRDEQEKATLRAQVQEATLRAEISDLRLQCEAMETEIETLETAKAEVIRENDQYKQHLTRLQDESWGNSVEAKRALEQEASLNARIAELSSTVEVRGEKIAALESALNDMRLTSEQTVTAFEKERADLLRALTRAQDVVFEKQAESLQSKATQAELQKTIQQLKARPVEKVIVHVGQEFVDDLKISNAKLKASLKEAETSAVSSRVEASEKTKEIARLRVLETELRADLARLTKAEAELRGENEDLREVREELLKTERALRLEIETLRFESHEQDQSLSTISQTAKDLERAFADERASFTARERELERVVSSLKGEVSRSQAAYEATLGELREFELQILALNQRSDELRNEREAALRRAEVSDARFAAMTERFEADRSDFRARLAQEEADVTRLTAALKEKEQEVTAARSETDAKQAEIAGLHAEIREAKAALGRAALGEAQSTTGLREQIARKEAELAALNETYAKLLANRDELKEAVRELRAMLQKQEMTANVARIEAQRQIDLAKAEAVRVIEAQRAETAAARRETEEARRETETARRDIDAARAETAKHVEIAQKELNAKIEVIRVEANAQIENVRVDAATKIETARREAANAVATARGDANAKVGKTQFETKAQIEAIQAEAQARIQKVEAEAKAAVEAARAEAVAKVEAAKAQLEAVRAETSAQIEAMKAAAAAQVNEAKNDAVRTVMSMQREMTHLQDTLKNKEEALKNAHESAKHAMIETEDVKRRVATEASLKVKAVEQVRQNEIEVANLMAKIREMEETGVARLAKERAELEKQAQRLELREQQLRHYAQTVQDERAEVVRCTQQLAGEIHAARSMNPLEDYLKLTEFELSKIELQLKKTPTLSSERPKLEKFLGQMTEQRDFLLQVIEQSKANLDQQSKKLAKIVEAARLSPLPPLPPKQK